MLKDTLVPTKIGEAVCEAESVFAALRLLLHT